MIQCLLGICFLFSSQKTWAQQSGQPALYMENNYLLNPALSGIENYVDLRLSSRIQWLGLVGSPRTYYISAQGAAHQNHRKKHRGGAGAILEYDQTGANSRIKLSGSYAYHVPLAANLTLSFGFSGGFTQYQLDNTLLTDQAKPDPLLGKLKLSQWMPSLGAGLWLYHRRYYVGIAADQLFPGSLHYGTSQKSSGQVLIPKYYISSGLKFYWGEKVSLTPSMMLQYTKNMPLLFDATLKIIWDERLWIAGSYRHKSSPMMMTGIHLNDLLSIAYAYDSGISSLQAISGGSHEVILAFKLKNKEKVRCPQNIW